MRDSIQLPLRPARDPERNQSLVRGRERSRSRDRIRLPLRERNVKLLNAEDTDPSSASMTMAHRPKFRKPEYQILAWMGLRAANSEPQPPKNRKPSATPVEPESEESDADDITIMDFRARVAMPASTMLRDQEAIALA